MRVTTSVNRNRREVRRISDLRRPLTLSLSRKGRRDSSRHAPRTAITTVAGSLSVDRRLCQPGYFVVLDLVLDNER